MFLFGSICCEKKVCWPGMNVAICPETRSRRLLTLKLGKDMVNSVLLVIVEWTMTMTMAFLLVVRTLKYLILLLQSSHAAESGVSAEQPKIAIKPYDHFPTTSSSVWLVRRPSLFFFFFFGPN